MTVLNAITELTLKYYIPQAYNAIKITTSCLRKGKARQQGHLFPYLFLFYSPKTLEFIYTYLML